MNAKQRRIYLRRMRREATALGITLPAWGWHSPVLIAGAIDAYRLRQEAQSNAHQRQLFGGAP